LKKNYECNEKLFKYKKFILYIKYYIRKNMEFKNFVEPTMDDLKITILDPIYTKKNGKSSEANKLYDFLDNYKIDSENNNGELIYNIISRKPNGKYYIPENDFDRFTHLLNSCADEVCIGELQNKNGSGLKLDFDIILNSNENNKNNFSELISYICTIILSKTNYLDKSLKQGLNFLILKKPEIIYVEDKGYYKDGFHIVFPTLKLSRADKRCLIDFINNDEKYNKIISDIYGDVLKCETNQVLDKNVCSNPIFFPRCRSKPYQPAYKISKIFNLKNLEITELDILTFNNIIKDFSLNFNNNKNIIYKVNKKIIEKYNNNNNNNNFINLNKYKTPDNKLNEIKKLLLLLDECRYSYEDWVAILISIINYSNGDENAYKLFDNWCKDGKNYNKDENRTIWDGFISKLESGIKYNYSIATLKYFAKIDNIDGYNEYLKSLIIDYNKVYNEEEYYWQDFLNDMNKNFDNLELLLKEFQNKIKKVLILVHSQNDAIFRKISSNCILNFEKKQLKATFKYYEKVELFNKKTKKNVIKNKLKKIKIKTILDDLGGYDYIPNYDELDFKPFTKFNKIENYSKRDFNCWSGFQSTLLNEEDVDVNKIEMILNHIKVVWADNNEVYYDYILSWFKNIFTKPQLKSKVAIVLRSSEKQVGKGVIINDFLIPYVFGNKMSMSIAGLNPIVSRFNSIMMNKLFINADELSTLTGNYHTTFDTLLKRITDPTINIEIKGGKSFIYPDYSNYIMCTNNNFTLKINEGDSRYFLTECSAKYKGDYDYFEKLVDSFNQETADHFYSYICYYKNKTIDIRNIPMTKLKYSLMKQSFQNPIHYLISIRNIQYEEPNIKASLLYKKYKDWCSICNEKPLSNTKFGRCIGPYITKFRSNGFKYDLNSIDLPFINEEFEIQENQI